MLEFIRLLKNRYQSIAQKQKSLANLAQIEQLILAEAFMQKDQLIDSVPNHAPQIAVIGPTQTGKSTVVNLLLNSSDARVSALAGYTVHPQAFCVGVKVEQCGWLKQYFVGYKQIPQAQLDADYYASYSLMATDNEQSSIARGCLVWDTPDFDSIDSSGYREGVLRAVALADMIILVVSKEKYADQAVWDILFLLEPLNKPTIIVVNKLTVASQELVLNSLQEKWRLALNQPTPTIIPLLYQVSGGLQNWPESVARKISKAIITAKNNPRKHLQAQKNYLNRHWQTWLAPVLAEYKAQAEWKKILDVGIEEALEQYQRDYLNHPHHYATFNNAILELLTLLEIPGIAKLIAKSRRILTWPLRKIFSFGRIDKNDRNKNILEVVLIKQKAEHLLIQLATKALDKASQDSGNNLWWRQINNLLRAEHTEISSVFEQSVLDYHDKFQYEIENTARQLYQKLQEQPLTLNSLRATRLTTDSIALVLAIHAGGIGLHDLIIMPVILSVTSLLAESALGSYMHRVEAELKQKQLSIVKQNLFEEHIKVPLLNLSDKLDPATQFNISKEKLASVELQLIEKKHELF